MVTTDKVARLTYLKAGQAEVGLHVQVEKSHNQLLGGVITGIEEPPARRHGRPRRCLVRLSSRRTIREYEDRLLIGG